MSIQHTQVIDCPNQEALHPTQVKSNSIDNHHCSGRLSRTLLASAVALALCGPGLVGSTQAATINAGDDAICGTAPNNNRDQRGRTRPSGPSCDIGAFEFDEDGFIVILLQGQKAVIIPSG